MTIVPLGGEQNILMHLVTSRWLAVDLPSYIMNIAAKTDKWLDE
jgi:hypothetical protein